MSEVLNKIKQILRTDITSESETKRIRPANSEVFRLWGDNTLIKELTGFQPDYTIDQGLQLTCDWFLNKENRAKYKSEIYNV
jgi:nucleoside-diphosphate-sugar epimerase